MLQPIAGYIDEVRRVYWLAQWPSEIQAQVELPKSNVEVMLTPWVCAILGIWHKWAVQTILPLDQL